MHKLRKQVPHFVEWSWSFGPQSPTRGPPHEKSMAIVALPKQFWQPELTKKKKSQEFYPVTLSELDS